MTVVNDLLQGKLIMASRDTTRFLINSTVGLGGIFDVASKMDLPRRREDFGQTLAVWGVPSGPYLVLPFFGPGSIRHTSGLVLKHISADPVSNLEKPEKYYTSGLRIIETRESLLGLDELLALQPDQYIFMREAYQKSRNDLIFDGEYVVADQDTEDDLINQILED